VSDIADKALAEAIKKLKGWKKAEINAFEAGWEYVLDNTCLPKGDGYDISRWPTGDGSDEARDLADGCEGIKNKEAAADCVYTGITAALKFVRSVSVEQDTESSD
jgi:hypothetical protein